MSRRPHDWTAHRVELLRIMWAQGVGLAEISERLGGISAPAISVKAHDLKLGPHPAAGRRVRDAEPAPRACSWLHLVAGALAMCCAPTSKRPADHGGGRHQYCDGHRITAMPAGSLLTKRRDLWMDGRAR